VIRVLFFGPVAERIGVRQLQREFSPETTLQTFHDELAARYPQAFEIVCLAAVNGEHIRDWSIPLADNSEVTFMAKFSGG
jgi:molybdopterin synthase sulfur carrier subunit